MTNLEALSKFVESDVYSLLFDSLRGKYLREFENSKAQDFDIRQGAYVKLSALNDLDKEIRVFLTNLKLNKRGE